MVRAQQRLAVQPQMPQHTHAERTSIRRAPTRPLVVRAQQRLAVGVDLPHVGQSRKEGRPHLFPLQADAVLGSDGMLQRLPQTWQWQRQAFASSGASASGWSLAKAIPVS